MTAQQSHTIRLERLFLLAQIGLVLLIIYLCVRTLIAFAAPESLWTLPPQNEAILPAASAQAQQNYSFDFDPFHRGQAPVVTPLGEDAPETTLNLKLFGLRAGENGTAILQTPDNRQGVYSIDDEVINGVTLKSISPGFIVLSINGKLERLTFDRGQQSGLRAPKSAQRLTAQDFARDVEIKPAIVNGKIQGYRVTPRFGAGKLDRYGLQDGDILVRLGGTDLTKGQLNWPVLAQKMSQTREINAVVKRSGKLTTVKVKL